MHELEADQHALGVRQVADQLLDRFRQFSDERRDGDDLIAAGELWVLDQVDHFDFVPSREVRVADLPQV